MTSVHKSIADDVPHSLVRTSCEFVVPIIRRFRGAQQFLANLVCMLVEEPVQHDHICLVPRRVKPFILIIFRRHVFLRQTILAY